MRLLTQPQSFDKDQLIDLSVTNRTRLAEKGIVATGYLVNR